MSDRRWRDGSEDRIVSVLRAASDRSSASDELATQIDDWPTRYHFGRARTNLLHPIRLGPSVRVLDVGAGSGVNSRWAAEQGCCTFAMGLNWGGASSLSVYEVVGVVSPPAWMYTTPPPR